MYGSCTKGQKVSRPSYDHPVHISHLGRNDQIFALDLGYRSKSHLGESAEPVVLKKTGHAINMEQPKELCRHVKLFIIIHWFSLKMKMLIAALRHVDCSVSILDPACFARNKF